MWKAKKTRLILYLSGVFVVAQVAANVGGDRHEAASDANVPALNNPELEKKIRAFKKGGVERKVNTDDYDIEGIIDYAESLLGTPHLMGGYSTSGLDCSGLVKLAHAQFGVELPRSSHDQGRYGSIISPGEELHRGDLVFFHSTYKKSELITHSGIYIGDNKFIHASTSRGVTVSTLFDSGYYQNHYLFATRLAD
jgi:cell wall-associated NlpC family hydrolase